MSQLERMSVLVFLIFLMGWRDYQMGAHGGSHVEVAAQKVIFAGNLLWKPLSRFRNDGKCSLIAQQRC